MFVVRAEHRYERAGRIARARLWDDFFFKSDGGEIIKVETEGMIPEDESEASSVVRSLEGCGFDIIAVADIPDVESGSSETHLKIVLISTEYGTKQIRLRKRGY